MSDTRDEGTQDSANGWKRGEEKLREREIKLQEDGVRIQREGAENQRKGTRAQSFTAIAAVVAASAAVWISFNAREAIDVAKHSVERQAEENRIATAVGGIQGDGPVAQRIAAFALLQREAVQKLENASEGDATDAERRDALNFFRTTLKTLEGYVRDPVGFTRPDPWGVGNAEPPRDVHTVGVDINRMLTYRALFDDVRGDRGDLSNPDRELPHLDLSFTSLYRVGVGPIDTSWMRPGDFHSIDLRWAHIENSQWQGTNLDHAFLRCAFATGAQFNKRGLVATNLSNADMRWADLRNADLRGANLTGALLEGAKLNGANVDGADFAGANIDRAALSTAVRSEKAKHLDQLQPSPAGGETQPGPEC